jgi:hypothetical protein
MQRTLGTLALVALLVLAGCGGPSGSGGTNATTIDSSGASPPNADGSSTASTVSANAAATSGDLPPGVNESGIENTTALLQAHQAALVESGFETVVRRNGTGVQANRTVAFDQSQRVVAAAGAETYRSRVVLGGQRTAYNFWSNGSTALVRAQVGNRTRYQRSSGRPTTRLTSVGLLGTTVAAGNYTLTAVNGSGDERRITLQTRTLTNASLLLPANATNVSGYESTLVLDGEGRLRSLEAVANYTIGEREARYELRYVLQQAGDVAVERPSWVGTALNRSGTNSPTVNRSGPTDSAS